MIIVKLKGGLGNQLFQYAFGRLISIKRNDILKLDIEDYLAEKSPIKKFKLFNYNINAEIASKDDLKKYKYKFGIFSYFFDTVNIKVLRGYHIGFEESLFRSKNNYFDGYFQSYRYLAPIRKQMIEEISLKNQASEFFKKTLSRLESSNAVSLHIRRGDYVDDVKNKYLLTFGLEYYNEAVSYIKQTVVDPVFYIFSDDIDWAKNNLKIGEAIFVSSPDIKDYEELVLMSKCKHNIIANSSFSFWGAWLNQNFNKIVIAPKKWSNKFVKQYSNIAPPDWIRL